MLSIKDRCTLVNTIDTLSQLDQNGNSVVALLHQLRGERSNVFWRILYAERLCPEGPDTQTNSAEFLRAQALVELTVSGRRRTNVGESMASESSTLLLSAVTNALVPMLITEIAAIKEAEDMRLANRDLYV